MIEKLKDYFKKHPAVVMAFVFGSRGRGEVSPRSDWDIAVYFKSSASLV
ncbi:nucleotidyltransferase domain-containing protein, partial [bacterium]